MKKILYIIILMLGIIASNGCEDNVELPVLNQDEYPRILGRWPDRDADGNLGVFDIPINQTLTIALMFTPTEYCVGTWYLDGVEVWEGNVFEFSSSTPVTHNLKLIVKTSKNTTSREANLVVLP